MTDYNWKSCSDTANAARLRELLEAGRDIIGRFDAGTIGYLKDLQMQLENARAQLVRLKEQYAETESLVNALELVVRSFERPYEAESSLEGEWQAEDTNFALKPKEAAFSFRATGREYFHELPFQFTKDDVLDLLKRKTGVESVNENTLRNVIHQFVKNQMAVIKIPAFGKSPQVYEKTLIVSHSAVDAICCFTHNSRRSMGIG